MEDSKKRLFEIMKKINVDFINEYDVENNPNATSDVKNVARLKTDTLKNAYSRVNNMREFEDAFKLWFTSLGFDPEKNPVNITTVVGEITNILKNLGYKH